MPLYLREADVAALLEPADAIAVVRETLRRPAPASSAGSPLRLDGGQLDHVSAADRETGLAHVRAVASFGATGSSAAMLLYDVERPELLAVVEARRLLELRAGATAAVATGELARADAATLAVIGCGRLAAAAVECVRVVMPRCDRIVAWCRSEERLAAFCFAHGGEPAEYGRDAAEQDVIVVATTSHDPVLRGEWLLPGGLVCAAGAVLPRARELDNVTLERAGFVCCDSVEQARRVAWDLVEPVERGVLDWLEVHELAEVVADANAVGRQADADIVVCKIAGSPALDLALLGFVVDRARERGVGTDLGD